MQSALKSAIVALALAPAVWANPTVTITSQGPTDNNGGPFQVTTTANGDFTTFCIETTEYLNVGGTFQYEISSVAKYNNAPGGSDPISTATAWLFLNYKAVSGWQNDSAQNGAVQLALWHLEGESGGANNSYAQAATTAAASAALAGKTAADLGVFVMNLYDKNMPAGLTDAQKFDYRKQDLLISVPDGGLTIAMLGMGLAGLGCFARRRQ